eukprot:tig00001437_g8743.t1
MNGAKPVSYDGELAFSAVPLGSSSVSGSSAAIRAASSHIAGNVTLPSFSRQSAQRSQRSQGFSYARDGSTGATVVRSAACSAKEFFGQQAKDRLSFFGGSIFDHVSTSASSVPQPAQVATRSQLTEDKTATPDPKAQSDANANRSGLLQLYRVPGMPPAKRDALLAKVRRSFASIEDIETEQCFNVDTGNETLTEDEMTILKWLLSETFEPARLTTKSWLLFKPQPDGDDTRKMVGGRTAPWLQESVIVEVGPRMSFMTAWSTNAVQICHACGLTKVKRVERSRRFRLLGKKIESGLATAFANMVHDRMTEQVYPEPLKNFDSGMHPEPVFHIPLMKEGKAALEKINKDMGLAFDDWDLEYYFKLFTETIGRDPTNVELFDMAQSNSEHSRHWFFKGDMVIDGEKMPQSLLKLVMATWKANPHNSTIAFKDNSSAITGAKIRSLFPEKPGQPSRLQEEGRDYDILFTAETHNFPCAVAPFPGAETGAGGRIRDTHATGVGSLVVASTAGYSVGNLNIPGYSLPWEDSEFMYPSNLASPLQIAIEASNGASDYGNKFGEPLIQGFLRTVGLRLPSGERREYIKPIMFSGGAGQIDSRHREKSGPEPGMWVVKVGGPAYRIGFGGGAASSMVSGDNKAELDFNAVQRGDAEMAQKVNRVIRACVEMGDRNPIVSIHDQGAGGNCNVVKEIVYPSGAKINIRSVPVGDESLSVAEIWSAEYQENDCLLLRPEDRAMFEAICERECVTSAFIGQITGDGFIVVEDPAKGDTPVNLDLEKVLGEDMPNKTFVDSRSAGGNIRGTAKPLAIPEGTDVRGALERVLRLASVGSKRWLTNKVDRSVTGLVAQQQCCGPLQLPVSDVAVIAQSHFGKTGSAIAIGEQPMKGLVDPSAMGRMSVAESLTNLVWASTTGLRDVKCSGNWMWAAKMPGEGAAIYDTCAAMADFMIKIGMAVDGGKDSLTMAARAPLPDSTETETVKAPGTLVISAYVTCPDVTKTVTPDLKLPGRGKLLFVDLSGGKARLGGSALAQVFSQVGNEVPDVEEPEKLVAAFAAVQQLVDRRLLSAGHDRSDGGLVTALLEMAFAGNCGIDVELSGPAGGEIAALFAEELGLCLEVAPENEAEVTRVLSEAGVAVAAVGSVVEGHGVRLSYNGQAVLEADARDLRDVWEETSFQLERLQSNPECVQSEQETLRERTGVKYVLPFQGTATPAEYMSMPTAPLGTPTGSTHKPRVAIIREEGSNGDREMSSAFHMAGFDVWDVTMSDLKSGRMHLRDFRGIAFVGGFSYADVLDSAKGWAGSIRFNETLRGQFDEFHARPDTFSLGVCNGCQLMALLGWIPGNRPHRPWMDKYRDEEEEAAQAAAASRPSYPEPGVTTPRFVHNASGRFESRWSAVRVEEDSPAIMLKDMGGATLGVWVAHGEGRCYFPLTANRVGIPYWVLDHGLAPIRYVDDENEPTTVYPFNPNGSPLGVASLCSLDGRHLALMPHPERAVLKWQWSHKPAEWRGENGDDQLAPWIKMFQNARDWCAKTADQSQA